MGIQTERGQHRRVILAGVGGRGVAHFLVADGHTARGALEASGIRVLAERAVIVQRLRQDLPGQLGMLTRRMAESGVNIEVLYSDHDHRLVLVVDDFERGRAVSAAWTAESTSNANASSKDSAST